MKLTIALALALLIPSPALATGIPDLTITASDPGTVPDVTTFTVTFTVTNIGDAPGKALLTDSFSTNFTPVAFTTTKGECAWDYTLVRSRRQLVGLLCALHELAPGEVVTVTETLRTKYLSRGSLGIVNRNANVEPAETNHDNNRAPWDVL